MIGLVFFLKEKLSLQHVLLTVTIQVCWAAMNHEASASPTLKEKEGQAHLATAP